MLKVHDCMCNSADTAKQLVRRCSVRTQTVKKKTEEKRKGEIEAAESSIRSHLTMIKRIKKLMFCS